MGFAHAYFSYKVTGKLHEGQQSFFIAYNHGWIPLGLLFNFGVTGSAHKLPLFKGKPCLLAVSRNMFVLPGLRELCLWSGCINCSRESISHALEEGYSVILYVGGSKEAAMNSDKLDLDFSHKGFLNIAQVQQVNPTPVFCKGENEVFWTSNFFGTLRRKAACLLGYPFPTVFWPIAKPVNVELIFGKQTASKEEEFFTELQEIICDNVSKEKLSETLRDKMNYVRFRKRSSPIF